MNTKSKSSSNTQKCGRCHRNLKRDAYSPSKWGHAGKWCRSCRKAYRVESAKKSPVKKALKTGLVVKHRQKKAIKAHPVSKVLRQLEALAPPAK